MPLHRVLPILAIMFLAGFPAGARARGGFGGAPALGGPGIPGGIAVPSGGFGPGGPFGLGGPALGTGLGPRHGGVSSSIQGAASAINHLATLPSQAANAISRNVLRDQVGRPTDPVIISEVLAHDRRGNEIVRNEVIAISPMSADLAIAKRLHFKILRRDRLSALGLVSITLRAPRDMTTITALALLRRADPAGNFDYSSIYNPAGSAVSFASSEVQPSLVQARHITLGMIDGGIDRRHPSLIRSHIAVRSFSGDGKSPPTQHGTAIASLLVGHGKEFSGYLPGASLYAADVYGGAVDGGSAVDIARALNWLAKNGIAVTNVSLAGPPNRLLAAAVQAFIETGHILVAAAGNDGPAAPPNYPAAYPGVICVTSVDADRHFELDANRNHCRFAALGVDVRAARFPKGYGKFTGTSYATPVVTANVARLVPKPDRTNLRQLHSLLLREATIITDPKARSLYILPPPSQGARSNSN